jgi:uncharacterized cofD-like protein
VDDADWVVLGPGSWFTSVIPHLLVPELSAALHRTPARRVVVLNLEPQPGETSGFSPHAYLEVLARQAPGLRIDAVVADEGSVADVGALQAAARLLGADVVRAPLRGAGPLPHHDPQLLAGVLASVLSAPQTPRTTPE